MSSEHNIKNEKARIRLEAKQRRNEILDGAKRSADIWLHLRQLPEYQKATTIFAYAHTRSEVETVPYLQEEITAGRKIALPICKGSTLVFQPVIDLATLAPGAFGILEPSLQEPAHNPSGIIPQPGDVILLPGLAFSKTGQRIGYGAGFYDRFLNQFPPGHGIHLIGLGFNKQVYDSLPQEPQDALLTCYVDELGAQRI